MSAQPSLLDWTPPGPRARFDGADYSPAEDDGRLSDQLARIKALMMDGGWRTLAAISDAVRAPPASVSAQLRHLRKDRFGGYTVERRKANERGLYEYRVLPPGGDSARKPSKAALRIAELEAEVARLREHILATARGGR